MTPYLTRYAVRALNNRCRINAWMIARFSRVKKIPELEDILIADKPERDHSQMEKDMKRALRNYRGKR
jgi:hypothetical protein